MTRRSAAMLTALALALCFGRVSALAAAPGDPHACCAGESPAPAKGPIVAECCATPAAVTAPRSPALDLVLVDVPAFVPSSVALFATDVEFAAPPGPMALRAAVPSRAPPLA